MRDRFRNPAIVVVILFLILAIVILFALSELISAKGETLRPHIATKQENPQPMPVCSAEVLENRPIHPPELTSCKEFVNWQNQVAKTLNLPRMTEGSLSNLWNSPELFHEYDLIKLEDTTSYRVDKIQLKFRLVYRYVADYLLDLSQRYNQQFHKPLDIVSAARSEEWQWLITQPRINGHRNRFYNPNAFIDPEHPDAGSMHEYLLAFDISLKHMNKEQRNWMQNTLVADIQHNHRIQVAEESIKRYRHHKLIGSRVIADHVVVFNASFLELYAK